MENNTYVYFCIFYRRIFFYGEFYETIRANYDIHRIYFAKREACVSFENINDCFRGDIIFR